MKKDSSELDRVSALERGFRILHCLADAGRPVSNGELSKATGIPAASTSRLVATLVSMGHVRPAPDSDAYELASGVVRLAQGFLGAIDVRRYARPHLAQLSVRAEASTFIGIRDGDDVLVVEGSRWHAARVQISADIGTRMSIRTSALGRAWWAGVTEVMRDAMLAEWRHRLSAQERAALLRSQHETTARGYAISLGEWHPGINAVAVPIATASGAVFSLSCGGSVFDLPPEHLTRHVVPLLLQTAEAIAKDIGGHWGKALMQTAPVSVPPQATEAGRAPRKPATRRTRSKETT